jgi:drug/metabolite transporter (DMT)-like permease
MAVVILGLVLFIRRQFEALNGKGLLRLFGVGSIIAFHWVMFYASIKYANASVALVCFAATGFFTAVFEPFLIKRKFILAELLLGIFSLAGIFIIFGFNPHFQKGIIFGIISSMGSAIFPVLNKKLVDQYKPRVMTFYELAGAFIFLSLFLPFYLMQFPASYYLPNASDWLWLLMLVVFCTVLAFELQLNALKKVSAFTSNLTYSLEPVYGVILAFIILNEGEAMGRSFFIGLSVVALAVVIQMRRVIGMKDEE